MKFTQALCLLSLLIAVGCNNESPDVALPHAKVASISYVGKFTYQNGILISAETEKFLYDNYNNLIASRMYEIDTMYTAYVEDGVVKTKDTVIHTLLTRYSYKWIGGAPKERMLDTLQYNTYYPKHDHPDDQVLVTNLLSAEYYYNNNRLDSVHYASFLNDSNIERRLFEYDERGNISRIYDYYHWRPATISMPYYSEAIIEFEEYDNHPNPYNLLFTQTGVLLPRWETNNFSPNNPIRSKIKLKEDDQWIELTNTWRYLYNDMGLPGTIIINEGTELTIVTYE